MKAETRTLQQVLMGDRRFVVPVYQRPYVWEQEKQWEPLWNDIEATVVRLGESRQAAYDHDTNEAHADQDAAPHFLGAIVIEDKPVMTGDVDTRLVVDGQQRLTTIQLLIRGILDALVDAEVATKGQARLRKAITNDDEIVAEDLLFKVAPRESEITDFVASMQPVQPNSDTSKFAAARAFFATAAASFLTDDGIPMDPYVDGSEGERRARLLVDGVLGLVKLVVIDLEDADDAQIIFESLNARGTPLSASDLVKNLLFHRAEAEHLNAAELYDSHWKRFDDDSDWWMQSVGTGHAQRPRQDWLLGDWLIVQLGRTISVGRLYGEFRRWLDTSETKPFDALSTLSAFADAFEVLNGRRPGATERELLAYSRIQTMNITVATPVLLELFVLPPGVVTPEDRQRAVLAIESYLVRRMLAREQTRAYGQVFVEVLKAMRHPETSRPADAVVATLQDAPHGYPWASTTDIAEAFATSRYYGPGGLNQARLRMVLGAIDAGLQAQASKSEPVTIDYNGLQIEHIIPQSWKTFWPLEIEDPTALAVAETRRERVLHRIGNLTMTTGPLNATLSHNPWEAKKAELAEHSHLKLNQRLLAEDNWDEANVETRSQWLATQVDEIWPGPDAMTWGAGDHE